MDLSRRQLGDEKDGDADLEEAVKRSLRETTQESSENEQIALAIKASLEEIVKNGTAAKYPSNTLETKLWTMEEIAELENVACQETPSSLGDLNKAMAALEKPSNLWPGLHAILSPLRTLQYNTIVCDTPWAP